MKKRNIKIYSTNKKEYKTFNLYRFKSLNYVKFNTFKFKD